MMEPLAALSWRPDVEDPAGVMLKWAPTLGGPTVLNAPESTVTEIVSKLVSVLILSAAFTSGLFTLMSTKFSSA